MKIILKVNLGIWYLQYQEWIFIKFKNYTHAEKILRWKRHSSVIFSVISIVISSVIFSVHTLQWIFYILFLSKWATAAASVICLFVNYSRLWQKYESEKCKNRKLKKFLRVVFGGSDLDGWDSFSRLFWRSRTLILD